jgi:hypothetical protein
MVLSEMLGSHPALFGCSAPVLKGSNVGRFITEVQAFFVTRSPL